MQALVEITGLPKTKGAKFTPEKVMNKLLP